MRERQRRLFRKLPPTRVNTLRKMSANTRSPERSLREQWFACWGTYFTDAIDGQRVPLVVPTRRVRSPRQGPDGQSGAPATGVTGNSAPSLTGCATTAAEGLRAAGRHLPRAGFTEDPPGSAHARPPCNRADAVTRGRHRSPWRVPQHRHAHDSSATPAPDGEEGQSNPGTAVSIDANTIVKR